MDRDAGIGFLLVQQSLVPFFDLLRRQPMRDQWFHLQFTALDPVEDHRHGLLHHEQKCSDCLLKIKCSVNMERSGIDSQYEVVFLESIPLLSNLLNAFVKFRNIYQAWPKLLLISRKNRYFSVRKRGVTQRVNEQITSDSFVFWTPWQKLVKALSFSAACFNACPSLQ